MNANVETAQIGTKKQRSSNLELLRIISMLAIVAHHFVVNSGITSAYDLQHISANTLYLQLLGMWGKTAINVFVLISGYFMCKAKLTLSRFCKVYLEAKFYRLVIFVILLIMGYETISPKGMLNVLFGFIRNPNGGFTSSFLMFYLFIPFYNVLIHHMTKKQHEYLLAVSLIYFTAAPTFLFAGSVFHEPLWYAILYFIAAYIRHYPQSWMNNNRICIPGLICLALLSGLSVIVVDFVGVRFGFSSYYYMVADSNMLLALLVSIFVFLVFKNINMKHNKMINCIASTTFGVLCIHASSDAMRKFLWQDLLKVPQAYALSLPLLMLYSIASVIGVFAVCSVIDFVRIHLIEKPLFNKLNQQKWFCREII